MFENPPSVEVFTGKKPNLDDAVNGNDHRQTEQREKQGIHHSVPSVIRKFLFATTQLNAYEYVLTLAIKYARLI